MISIKGGFLSFAFQQERLLWTDIVNKFLPEKVRLQGDSLITGHLEISGVEVLSINNEVFGSFVSQDFLMLDFFRGGHT